MGMTIVEKILARASGNTKVAPGDVTMVNVDVAVMLDMDFYPTFYREMLKVHDVDKIVVIYDHMVPAPDRAAAEAHMLGREFVRRFGIRRFHDVGPDTGISHVVVAERGYALPGTVLVCSDSHTCSAGALNCAARGIGPSDMIYAVTRGETWFRVGETVRYDLAGRMPPGVSVKDLFLYMVGTYGEHANQNVEYGGSALPHLSMTARRTLTTMGAELSAEFSTFDADDVLIEYIKQRNPAPFEPQHPDADAAYAARRTIRLGEMQPMIALPDAVINNTVPVGQVAGEPIQQAFIGSCANGNLEDLAEAARVVKGRQVAAGTRFLITPGSQAILQAAVKAGYVQTLMEAGAVVTTSSCGACAGLHNGIVGPGEACVTASTRNFKGRMGHPDARIYMASPATVAASAIAGRLIHPGEMQAAGS